MLNCSFPVHIYKSSQDQQSFSLTGDIITHCVVTASKAEHRKRKLHIKIFHGFISISSIQLC